MFGKLLQTEAISRLHFKSVWRPTGLCHDLHRELTSYNVSPNSAPNPLAGFERATLRQGRKVRKGQIWQERGGIIPYHQFLDLPLLACLH